MIRGADDSSNYDARNVAKVHKGRTWPVYKRLMGYVFKYKVRLAVAFVFGAFVAFSFGAILMGAKGFVEIVFAQNKEEVKAAVIAQIQDKLPWTPQVLIDSVDRAIHHLQNHEMQAMTWLACTILAVTILSGLARFLQEYLAASIATYVSIQLGQETFENIVRQPLRFYERHASGEIIARLTNDVFMAGRGLSQVFMKLLREPIKALVFLGVALYLDPGLTIIGLAVLPPVAFVIVRIGRSVRKRMRRSLERVAELQSAAKEIITGITIVKSFCMESLEVERMRREYHKLRRQGLKMLKADAAIGPLTELVMMCGVAVFVVLSARKVIDPDVEFSLADLGALYIALGMMLDPIRKLSAVNNAVQASTASAERVFEFIDMKPDIADAPGAVDLPPIREALTFENVSFTYDGDTPVLRDLDIAIRKGEMIAIVGFSGAGKSTIAKLIPRFYDVTGGTIAIDGVDIRRATLKSLREQISVVTQDTILFNETVAANIAAGQLDRYTPERIQGAAKAAHADGFVEALPRQYQTSIGESGGTLSGGQRQRLAIARALVKDPAILILDEATSSLDSESEQAIQEAIQEFVVGRTSIVIAHRLSTIQRADRILVLDEGRIVEQGTHEELLQQDGSIYRRLYEVQFAPTKKEEAKAGE